MQLFEEEIELLSMALEIEQRFFRSVIFTTSPHRKTAKTLGELGLAHILEERHETHVRLTTPGRTQLTLRGIC